MAEEFASSGEYEYYANLRGLYAPEEWPEVYARLMAELAKDRSWLAESTYVKLLIEEKETEKLLEYVRRHPRTVVDYYKHLIGKYPEEVYRVFEQQIGHAMQEASNRKEYKKGCSLIRELLKAGGRQQAKQVVESLRQRYPNRPALLDELSRIKIS
ncbi:hypothetical protein [Cohnella caldifontis]|uniref:hypothetical protein n=1 Tax=Cohnella caldifontis TaxID=3027471 RepID=UPI0023EC40C6|nr:hypothetical protein [Cohnella sp. YIM B05605]